MPAPVPFTQPLPLIGVPTLLAVVATVLAQCPCEARQPMLFVGINTVQGCPKCSRAWVLQAAGITPEGAQAQLVPLSHQQGRD